MSKQDDVVQEEELCPLSEAALLLNSKWDLVVIYNLLTGPKHFSELKKKISAGLEKPLTSSSLTRILRKLETDGVVKRNVTANKGESVDITYELSDKGKDLEPVILSLKEWGKKHLI